MSSPAYNIDETKADYGINFGPSLQSDLNNAFIYAFAPASATVDSNTLFRRLTETWKRETGHLSSVAKRIQHPAYRKIIEMGSSAIPLILKEIEENPDHWFHALYTLSGENPVTIDFTGTVTDALDLWIEWGHNRYATS